MLSNCFMHKILFSNLILRLLIVGTLPYSSISLLFSLSQVCLNMCTSKQAWKSISLILNDFFFTFHITKIICRLQSMVCHSIIGKTFFFLSVLYNNYLNLMKCVKCWIDGVWHEYNYVLWDNLSFHKLDSPKASYFSIIILMRKKM